MPFCPQGPLLPHRRVVTNNKARKEINIFNMSPSGHPSCKSSSCSNGNSHSNRAMPSLPQVICCFCYEIIMHCRLYVCAPYFSNDETLPRTGFAGEKGVKSHRSHKNSKCKYQVICSIIQGGFFNWSALKMTKYEEKLKYLNWSANCSSRKVLSVKPQ